MKKEKLFVAGLSNENFNEIYYIIDLDNRSSKEIIIDNTKEKEEIKNTINLQFSDDNLPYDSQNINQFLPYLINPHSCIKVGNKILSFMLQAPYFREIDLDSLESCTVRYSGEEYRNITFSASSEGKINDKEIYLSINSSMDRAEIYRAKRKEMGFSFILYNVEKKSFQSCKDIRDGLIDNMHQVGYSQNDFIVSLDMNISVSVDTSHMTDLMDKETIKKYMNAYFPKGKIFIWDKKNGNVRFVEPPFCTPAHVEFDLSDPSIFYVSCHNMSKFKSNMILHGPGAIVKYKYENNNLELLNYFSDNNFNRITTHKFFYYNKKRFLAVTGYPNNLYIIDADTMTLVKRIELFNAETEVTYEKGLFSCIGNRNAPLYLQVSSDGKVVYLVNNDTCFLVSWLREEIEYFKYTKNNFTVSAHMERF